MHRNAEHITGGRGEAEVSPREMLEEAVAPTLLRESSQSGAGGGTTDQGEKKSGSEPPYHTRYREEVKKLIATGLLPKAAADIAHRRLSGEGGSFGGPMGWPPRD